MNTTERAREERAADAMRTLTPTGLTPLAAEARHGYRQAKRITALEGQVELLLRVISRLEGHNDNDTARLRHLGETP